MKNSELKLTKQQEDFIKSLELQGKTVRIFTNKNAGKTCEIIDDLKRQLAEAQESVKELEAEKSMQADKWFIRGIAVACGFISHDENQPSMAQGAMHDVTKQDCINAGVPDFDMKKLKNTFAQMPNKPARYKRLLKKGDK